MGGAKAGGCAFGAGSSQWVKAAMAAWVVGDATGGASTANGEIGWVCGAGENGDAAGVGSKGLEANVAAGASNPYPSEGSAIWNGESIFRRSGNRTGRLDSTGLDSTGSFTTVNGESCRATAANGLFAACGWAGSGATENGESCRVAGWFG